MKKILCVLALACASTSCVIVIGDVDDGGGHSSHAWLDSEGPLAGHARTVEPFHALEVADASDVRVTLGATPSVVVTCTSALESFVRTEVKDGVLVVSRADEAPRSRRGVRIDVVVPALDAIAVRGSGDVVVDGLAAARLAVQVQGSGDVTVRGRADELDVIVQGSGDVKLGDLAARDAKVRIAGSGDVWVAPSEALDVEISGSGDVVYRGAPRITQRRSGSGDVRRD